MTPTITADIRPAKDYLAVLTKRELPRVIGRSLDRTASSGRSFLSTSLRQRLSLKKAVVDAGLSKRRSGEISNITALNLGNAWFEIRASGKPIPLKDYNARETARRGVTYQVSRSAGRRTYRAKGNLAFVVTRFGGNVFVRTGPNPPGPKGAKITKVFGPSLPQAFRTKREQDALIAHCEQFWANEVIRNARFALARR